MNDLPCPALSCDGCRIFHQLPKAHTHTHTYTQHTHTQMRMDMEMLSAFCRYLFDYTLPVTKQRTEKQKKKLDRKKFHFGISHFNWKKLNTYVNTCLYTYVNLYNRTLLIARQLIIMCLVFSEINCTHDTIIIIMRSQMVMKYF